MTLARAVTLAATMCLALLPVTGGEAALTPTITVVAGNGIAGLTHTAPVNGATLMQVTLSFLDLGGLLDDGGRAVAGTVDVYIGVILPDGRFVSWVGDAQGTTFATGPSPVPLFSGLVPTVGDRFLSRVIEFSTISQKGWYILYGLVVRAGAPPLDPREWGGANPTYFYPFLVVPPVTN